MSDLDDVYTRVEAERKRIEEKFSEDAVIRLWDGNWSFLGYLSDVFEYDFEFILNDAGSAEVILPVDGQMGRLLMDYTQWPTKSLYITFDKDGARWSGRVQACETEVNYRGDRVVRLTALHDYQKLKELLVWANPFLPPQVQFPKAWYLFGPSRWALATTLFCQLYRKNNALWRLPDDPMHVNQWGDFDMSTWSEVVKPVDFATDNSLTCLASSRFKTFHETAAPILNDAELAVECRRYLPGDPDPIPGKELREGCLVFEFVDKSGWGKQTAVGGAISQGFTRAIRRLRSDGLTEYEDVVPRVDFPDKYRKPGFLGSVPEAPWVVLEHGDYTGIESTSFTYIPPGATMIVSGGSSMPGVNETIKAGITTAIGFLGSLLMGQSQLGAAAAEVLEPLYSDVFMAFFAANLRDRRAQHGWDYPFEVWADGADQSYTLSTLSSTREKKWDTRERISVSVKMNNGCPYFVGPVGYGDFFIGDRVGVHPLGAPEDALYVEQVRELKFSSGKGWEVTVGAREHKSGLSYLADVFEKRTSALKQLGVW